MRGREVLCFTLFTLMSSSIPAWAMTTCVAEQGRGRPASTPSKIISRKDASGGYVFELTGRDASVRKVLDGKTTTTTLVSGEHQVAIVISGKDVVVSTPEKVWRGSAMVPRSLELAGAYLRQSTAAIAAKRLLDHTTLAGSTLEGNALLLTKALLGSFFGENTGTIEYQQWATDTLNRPHVTRASLADGPGDCWDKYAAEAIRIMDDWIDCANTCEWRGFFCMNACGFIYDIRAEAAFMWFFNCNGKFFVG